MLYFEEFGHQEAPALVLLHSGGLAGVEWQPQVDALASRYRLIIPDLPAHGRSPLTVDKLTIGHMANQVLDLLDRLNVREFFVCGSSMGGATALNLTINQPARVKKAVIYRISYRKTAATYEQTRQMARPEYWAQFGLSQWLAKLHEPQGGPEAWKNTIGRVCEALNPENSDHNFTLDDLAQIGQPVLLIGGDRDPVAPLSDLLDMYRTIANSALWLLPGANHITASNTWRAAAFAEEVKRFLSAPRLPPKLD